MVQRRGLPMSIYGVILIPIVVISYYISGIFSFPDVTIYNYSVYLEKVLAQFYKPWIWFNDKTPACIGVLQSKAIRHRLITICLLLALLAPIRPHP